MSQDVVADALNQVMNAKRMDKEAVIIGNSSRFLTSVLDIMKQRGYLDYEKTDDGLKIHVKKIAVCKAIKPRYTADRKNIDKYIRRFLPSRNYGHIIVSTNKGLMTHQEAQENKIGGSLIAYFY